MSTIPTKAQHNARALLRSMIRAEAGVAAAAIASGLVFTGSLFLFPLALARGVDDGVVARDMSGATFWGVMIVVVVLVRSLGSYGMSYLVETAMARRAVDLRERLSSHLLTLDHVAAQRFSHGDLVTRGTQDVTAAAGVLAALTNGVVIVGGMLAILVACFVLDPLLGWVSAMMVPALAAVNVFFPRWYAAANQRLLQANSKRGNAVEDMITAGHTVRGVGGEQLLAQRHHGVSGEVSTAALRAARINAIWTSASALMPAAATVLGVAVGGSAVLAGRLSVGDVLAFAGWTTIMWVWVGQLTARLNELTRSWTAAARLGEVLSLRSGLPEAQPPRPLPRDRSLELSGVVVALGEEGRLGLLDERIEEGQMLAVTGAIAVGKSSLARVLARVVDPLAGRVLLGGVDVRELALDELREAVALVGQKPKLVSGTIAENLRLGRPDLSDVEIERACHAAAIDDQIAAWPEGYRTVVGEQGRRLSGGQLQRLALARALVRQPSVLVLDDVTAAVDVDTEQRILDRLRAWRGDMTIVFITHRPAVIAAADRTLELGGTVHGEAGAGEGAAPALGVTHGKG